MFKLSNVVLIAISSAELIRRFVWRFLKYSQFPPLASQIRDTTRATHK